MQRIIVLTFLISIFLSIASSEAFAKTKTVTLEELVFLENVEQAKIIDRRKLCNPSELYQVILLSRGPSFAFEGEVTSPKTWALSKYSSLTGHSFVVLRKFNLETQKYEITKAFGLQPDKKRMKIEFAEASATFVDLDLFPDVGLFINVNYSDYEKIEKLDGKYDKQGEYFLLLKDCVTLVDEAAKILNLKRPSLGRSILTPSKYLQYLIDHNR